MNNDEKFQDNFRGQRKNPMIKFSSDEENNYKISKEIQQPKPYPNTQEPEKSFKMQ